MQKKLISEHLAAAIGIAGLATTEGLVRTFASLAGERSVRRALESLSGRGRDRRRDGDGGWERVAPGVRCLSCGRRNVVALWRRLPGLEQVTVQFGHGIVGWPVRDLRICEVKLPLHVYAQRRADWEARLLHSAEPAVERRQEEIWGHPTVHWALAAESAQAFAARLVQSIGPSRSMAQSVTEVDLCSRSLIGSVMLEAIRLAGVAGSPCALPLKRTVAETRAKWTAGGDGRAAVVEWDPPRATFMAPGRRIWVTTPYDLANAAELDSRALKVLVGAQVNWERFTLPSRSRGGRSAFQELLAGAEAPRMLLVTRREDLETVWKVLGTMPSIAGSHPAFKTRILRPRTAAVYLLTAMGLKVEVGASENS